MKIITRMVGYIRIISISRFRKLFRISIFIFFTKNINISLEMKNVSSYKNVKPIDWSHGKKEDF